jgi:hypothetical protein
MNVGDEFLFYKERIEYVYREASKFGFLMIANTDYISIWPIGHLVKYCSYISRDKVVNLSEGELDEIIFSEYMRFNLERM